MSRYSIDNLDPVHRLHYTWTGWRGAAPARPAGSEPPGQIVWPEAEFVPLAGKRTAGMPVKAESAAFPPLPPAPFLTSLAAAWRADGLAPIAHNWQPNTIQFTFQAAPHVAPALFTQRVKGRLQHALRQAGFPVAFSRKVGMRTIGENLTETVINYLREQLERADLADARYRATLAEQAHEDAAIDLSAPSETHSGRYWYNLHLVAVTDRRYRVGREDYLQKLKPAVFGVAGETSCRVKALAIMPDHVHVAMRGDIGKSPVELGVAFLNGMAAAAGCRLFQDRFYVGTFGEYSLRAVR